MHTFIFAIALAAATPALAQEQPIRPSPPVIVTTGDAFVRRVPDRAFVTIAVESRAKNPRDAQKQNAEAMTAVQQRLGLAKVPKDAVRTMSYGLEQEFEFLATGRVPRGFLARNSMEVRVDDIAQVGEVIDTIVRGGATSVDGLRFDVADRKALELEALRLAVADARGRADAAAAGAGKMVDGILRIEDARDSIMPPPRVMTMARSAEATTPIEPGIVEVHAHVTLTVSIR